MRGELETEHRLQNIDPRLFWLWQHIFPVLLGCSTRGLGVQPLLVLVLTPRTGTLTSNSDLQLTELLSHPGYIIVWHPPASCGVTIRIQFNPSTVKDIPWYLWPDEPVIYTGAFLIWRLGRVGSQYVTTGPINLMSLLKLLNVAGSKLGSKVKHKVQSFFFLYCIYSHDNIAIKIKMLLSVSSCLLFWVANIFVPSRHKKLQWNCVC